MQLPVPDPAILQRRDALVAQLAARLPAGTVITKPVQLAAYDGDALSAYRQTPLAVILPRSAGEVSAALALTSELGLKVVPRGAGTSLSGGALPLADGVVIATGKMNRIIAVDIPNRCIVAEPGVTNLALSAAARPHGFFYAPDPSSQAACTIGGNVAENAGGIHCLKYGVTTNNLLGCEIALPGGERVRLGGRHGGASGLDLLGAVTGSEGLLGIVTEVTVRLVPVPAATETIVAAFASVTAAAQCVADIIAAGIVPAAMEMMDARAAAAIESFCAPGYPEGAAAVLLIESDGAADDVQSEAKAIRQIALKAGALTLDSAATDEGRAALWAGRKAAFPAAGRLAPDMLCMDGTIPRRALPKVLAQIAALAAEHGLGVCNVFHAGDGNLHPLILFDRDEPGALQKAEALGDAILMLCVKEGGVLSGEHGIGIEKAALMETMFGPDDLAQQARFKCAFDPDGRMNPGKVFPVLSACVEGGRMHVHEGRMAFGHLPRL